MPQYKVMPADEINTKSEMIVRTDDDGKEWWIPCDLANADYQRYLAWLENPEAEQSTPNLAD